MAEPTLSQQKGKEAEEKTLKALPGGLARSLFTPLDQLGRLKPDQVKMLKGLGCRDLWDFIANTCGASANPNAEEVRKVTQELVDKGTVNGKKLLDDIAKQLPIGERAKKFAHEVGEGVREASGDIGFFQGASFLNGIMAFFEALFQYFSGNGHKDGFFATVKQCAFERTKNDARNNVAERLAGLGYPQEVVSATVDNLGYEMGKAAGVEVEDTRSAADKAPLDKLVETRNKIQSPERPRTVVDEKELEAAKDDAGKRKVVFTAIAKDFLKNPIIATMTQGREDLTKKVTETFAAAAETVKFEKGMTAEVYADKVMSQALGPVLKEILKDEKVATLIKDPSLKEKLDKFAVKEGESWKKALEGLVANEEYRVMLINAVLQPLEGRIAADFTLIQAIAEKRPFTPEEKAERERDTARARQHAAEEAKQAVKETLKQQVAQVTEKAMEAVAGKSVEANKGWWGAPQDLEAARRRGFAPNKDQQAAVAKLVAEAVQKVTLNPDNQKLSWSDPTQRAQLAGQVQREIEQSLHYNLTKDAKLDVVGEGANGGKASKRTWETGTFTFGQQTKEVDPKTGKPMTWVETIARDTADTLRADAEIKPEKEGQTPQKMSEQLDRAKELYHKQANSRTPEAPAVSRVAALGKENPLRGVDFSVQSGKHIPVGVQSFGGQQSAIEIG